MFTGIVEELGRVRALPRNEGGARIEITATAVLADAVLGASIAVNGCCLTVVELGDGWWAADAVTETLVRTSLGALKVGDPVNLERPLRLSDRLGGHLVQGHVDGVGELVDRTALPDGSTRMRFRLPAHLSALHRGEGLDHGGRHQPHRGRVARGRLRRRGHPAHARRHEPRREAAG